MCVLVRVLVCVCVCESVCVCVCVSECVPLCIVARYAAAARNLEAGDSGSVGYIV